MNKSRKLMKLRSCTQGGGKQLCRNDIIKTSDYTTLGIKRVPRTSGR